MYIHICMYVHMYTYSLSHKRTHTQTVAEKPSRYMQQLERDADGFEMT
jgi:hypothetical protein